MQDSIGVLLPWDSSFFGLRIGRLTVARLTPHSLSEALEWCRSHEIDCLYFLADSNHRETIQLAEASSFRFVDIRLTLRLSSFPAETNASVDCGVRLFEEADLDCLKVIARQSHSGSRFYFDGGFPKERCEALYETWIERSCRGWAKAVFVAELDGKAAGYCTCHIDGGVGSIGLVALGAHAQGRSMGRHLIAAAISYARQQGISELKVVTQGRNVRAQQLYQKCGFVTDSVMLWYHKWFREAPSGAVKRLS
jgi:dTDP-4-amino-4,6-dideoxy-D-galactose acyltransferase